MITQAPTLHAADLSAHLKKKEYEKRLKVGQHDLFIASRRLLELGVPLIIVFEGWDAAGKGGVIKRINEHLDPRGFHVHPTAAPTVEEHKQHYLQRFWLRLPQKGHIGVFDRSWYGRVLVERVEGFCSKTEWQRAYQELNEFERVLVDGGFLIRKYFLHIDAETQLHRFEARKTDPLKKWKLTDEDWRNREKWGAYEAATDDMLQKTHQDIAPWQVIPSTCKRWARIAVIEDLVKAMQETADAIDGKK